MNKAKKKRRWPINLVIALLFLSGLALIFNAPIRDFIINQNSNRYHISNVTRQQIEKNTEKKVTFDMNSVEPLSIQAVLAAQMDNQPLPVIGGIAIPELSVNLPIFRGVNNISLMYGAGTMKADQVMGAGNYALASHTSSGFAGINQGNLFTPLQHAKNGMMIYITDKANIYEYKITSVRVMNRSHIEVIDDVANRNMITLVTCETRGSDDRIIVQGDLTKKIAFNGAPNDILKSFELSYNVFYKPKS
ncbi:class A sortase [Lactococcus fujiensis]|uniref:Sortase A, LPXTG specific n=1 Tax=Lactococcus fujiensis JCM 16395 TaxID=1291764 RepID=A0A2A5RK77_9LACT|nr:class A sortase [Lactococcus fujiensis]PCR99611.1 Sortase A, LPXTG specific [Lactococcus fujiensis JCM 16395]